MSDVKPDAGPDKFCDIVLKGGITSGVVYPLALVSLSEEYRFSCIGGTSAGAIAAAAAAAAEYGRGIPGAGFERLAKIPDEIGPGLMAMFQPSPGLRPLYAMFVGALRAKGGLGKALAILRAAVFGYGRNTLLGALPGLLVTAAALVLWNLGLVAFGLLLTLVGIAVALVLRIVGAATKDLPANTFGLCPGIRQPGEPTEAFTDWLTRLADEAAGRKPTDDPITFGDLASPSGGRPAITCNMMTTSLMERRPYTLPMVSPSGHSPFYLERGEWAKIFPARIMTYLERVCERRPASPGESGEFLRFPEAEHLPLVVGARLSLSFPLLISAVPLWRADRTLKKRDDREKLRRCIFSDGGLSSNFPIHFFDNLLPNHPTFAITLDSFDEKRHDENDRTWLPTKAQSGVAIPVEPFSGLVGFLMRLVDSAKDWQDTMQSTLPGYRERIVHIALKPAEGGLNVAMDKDMIKNLGKWGEEAAGKLRSLFNLDAHRWRRFLVAMARMEETLDTAAEAYQAGPKVQEAYPAFLARYAANPDQYKQDPPVLGAMKVRGTQLAQLGASWGASPRINDGDIPKPKTALRLSPKP